MPRLAADWECSPTTIYSMIADGRLRSFPLGKRGLRVTDAEKRRHEREGKSAKEIEAEAEGPSEKKPPPLSVPALKAASGLR